MKRDFLRWLPPLAALLFALLAGITAIWLVKRGAPATMPAPGTAAIAPEALAPAPELAILEQTPTEQLGSPAPGPGGTTRTRPGLRPVPSSGVRVAPPRPARLIVLRRAQLPVGPLRDYVLTSFRNAKAGDADSIYKLGLALKECSEIDATPQALKISIERVYRTRSFAGMTVDDPAGAAAELERRYRRCEGISPRIRSRYYELMERAADLGSIEALESMVFQLPPSEICRERELSMCDGLARSKTFDLRRQQARWLHRAQELGSANALWQLGAAYMNGEMATTDKAQAYVYFRAYQIVAEAFHLEDRVERLIGDLKAELPAGRVREAETQARTVVANPNCCVYLR